MNRRVFIGLMPTILFFPISVARPQPDECTLYRVDITREPWRGRILDKFNGHSKSCCFVVSKNGFIEYGPRPFKGMSINEINKYIYDGIPIGKITLDTKFW